MTATPPLTALPPSTATPTPPLLDVHGLDKTFKVRRGWRATLVHALADVSFQLDRGEIVALVGESGSGKSTVARVLARLVQPGRGAVRLDGRDVLRQRASRDYRRRVQLIFQDPYASLNPAHTVGHHLERPLIRHGRCPTVAARTARVHELLNDVGLWPPAQIATRRPHELSGGQRQRVAIARALAVEPDLVIADEPTSMLDVSLRAGVLELLTKLKTDRRLALLFITHDLASARHVADRILVMYAGRVVEEAPADVLVTRPSHPYTRLLLASVPDPARPATPPALKLAPGATAPVRSADHAAVASAGCPFAGRCAWVTARCRTEVPTMTTLDDGHRVRCHRAVELAEAAA